MARFRKTAALIACAVMASTVTGCADTSYSAKYGDETVKAGVYIGYLQTELNNQLYLLSYQGVDSADYFSQQVEGVDLAEYVKNNSIKDVQEYIAIKQQFEAEGLSFSEDELKAISSNVKTSWDNMGGMYEYNGVSKESLKEIYRESLMRSMLFNHYYGEGGKEPPTDEELQTYVNDNFIRYKMIALYKSSSSDEATAAAENEEKLKTRDEFFEKGKNLNFENFDELIEEYNASSSSEEEEDTSSEEESSSADESSETGDDTSSQADSSSESSEEVSETTPENPSAEAEAEAEPESGEDAASEAESSSAAESEADSSSVAESEADSSSAADTDSTAETETEETEEPDPYENEVMIDLGSYTDEDFESASGQLFKKIQKETIGKVFTFENDNAYYIVVKGDVTQRTDYVSENRSTLVQSLKNDDFQAKLDGWVAAANITINDKAVKRYTPQIIYDRMVEYSEKNQ